jgi:hypothetical protein
MRQTLVEAQQRAGPGGVDFALEGAADRIEPSRVAAGGKEGRNGCHERVASGERLGLGCVGLHCLIGSCVKM